MQAPSPGLQSYATGNVQQAEGKRSNAAEQLDESLQTLSAVFASLRKIATRMRKLLAKSQHNLLHGPGPGMEQATEATGHETTSGNGDDTVQPDDQDVAQRSMVIAEQRCILMATVQDQLDKELELVVSPLQCQDPLPLPSECINLSLAKTTTPVLHRNQNTSVRCSCRTKLHSQRPWTWISRSSGRT